MHYYIPDIALIGNSLVIESLVDGRNTDIPANINGVNTCGYYSAGDGGGGVYSRVSSQPSHHGYFQSLDGAYWELAPGSIDIRQFGAKCDYRTNQTDDTQSIQNAIDAMNVNSGYFMLTGKGESCITRVTLNGAGKIYDLRGLNLIGLSATPINAAFEIMCQICQIYLPIVSSAFNVNYSTGIQWYSNDPAISVGFNIVYGGETSGFLVGFTIGGLRSQNSFVTSPAQPKGVAIDTALSESAIMGYTAKDCIIGVSGNQPNGKMIWEGCSIQGENNSWPDPSIYAAQTGAVDLRNAGTEFIVTSCSINQNKSVSGSHYSISSGRLITDNTIEEAVAPTIISGEARVTRGSIANGGYNGNLNFVYIILDNATGFLKFDGAISILPAANYDTSQVEFIRSASNSLGAYSPNFNFDVQLQDLELQNFNLPQSGSTYKPPIRGLPVTVNYMVDTRYSYPGNNLLSADERKDNGNVLEGAIDISADSLPAYAVGTTGDAGGWSFAVVGTCSYGKTTTGLPTVVSPAFDASLHISAASGSNNITASTSSFSFSKSNINFMPFAVKTDGSSSATVGIQVQWFAFDGTSISTVNLYGGTEAGLGAYWQPLWLWGSKPANASTARIKLYCENGAGIQVILPKVF